MALSTSRKQARRGLRLFIGILIALSLLLVLVNKAKWAGQGQDKSKRDEVIMLEKGSSPATLKSYQKITGVIDVQHWKTERGVEVYFVPVKTLPIVDIDVLVDAGAVRDKIGGQAYLTSQLLADGTAKLTADEVAENFDNVGAQFASVAQRDSTSISLRSLSDKTQFLPALQNMAKERAAKCDKCAQATSAKAKSNRFSRVF
jgi:hypothetical protein